MKNKKDNSLIIITTIISLILGITFLIYFLYYYNIKLTLIISIVVVLLTISLILYIPYRIAENKKQLVNELFLLDISTKSNDSEHIRITEKNILFKYKSVIKYYYVFPKLFSSFSLKGKIWETPTYNIVGKIQLAIDELNNIIEKTDKLKSDVDGDVIVNYKGNKKFVNRDDINKIFESYSIKI